MNKLSVSIKFGVINRYQVWSVSKLSTESVGSRRKLVANCVHTADAPKQFRRVCIGGVYWALVDSFEYNTVTFSCRMNLQIVVVL